MGMMFGITLLWLGAALLWVAFHHPEHPELLVSPWSAFQEVTDAIDRA